MPVLDSAALSEAPLGPKMGAAAAAAVAKHRRPKGNVRRSKPPVAFDTLVTMTGGSTPAQPG